ncbi:hypothetical protein R6Q59_027262 [Mikania micrantha]
MVRSMMRLCLIMIILVSLHERHIEAQVDCVDVILKLTNCESFLIGISNHPRPYCCASAQYLVDAANASRDVLKATCQCLKNAIRSFPVNLTNAAQLTSLCHLNLNVPISPDVNCDSL